MSEEPSGTRRFFLSYTGVQLPFNLVNELDEQQIENRNTYFCGYFDEQGRLTALHKLVYGELEIQHRYVYHENGVLMRAEVIDIDGDVTMLEFDEHGKAVSG
ncbi:hypothetical protein F6R98_11405 [Candidatus Methylospira mobilis]|uniref:RHS repeat protein n=1 Tax=Candidatus Methylospira mobilis TaxID=1808979 RepID=A0A5Q0BLQ5_9GAMM|nr:DUF6156 family protein [Candidatus Methylospira mobilis]QFY43151.1 hypothetical protein F6R98_11405 [Candidatus Methylospira mobilis]WNV03649.1 DUF6156 family protein [Candidatus Methylospira mobilis]